MSDLYGRFPLPEELLRAKEARDRWLGFIKDIMDREGLMEVTDPWKLDDPPYPLMLEMALILNGNRPAEQHTAMGELKKLAAAQKWEIIERYDEGWLLRASLKTWVCPSCEGRGIQPQSLRQRFIKVSKPEELMFRHCSECHGAARVTRSTNPEHLFCKIEFKYGHWMPKF